MKSGSGGNLLILALPVLLLVWLMMTQRRRQRRTAQFQLTLQVGQDVVTTSGLYGRIVALTDGVADLEISPGVQVRYDRRAIGVRPAEPQAGSDGSGTDGGSGGADSGTGRTDGGE